MHTEVKKIFFVSVKDAILSLILLGFFIVVLDIEPLFRSFVKGFRHIHYYFFLFPFLFFLLTWYLSWYPNEKITKSIIHPILFNASLGYISSLFSVLLSPFLKYDSQTGISYSLNSFFELLYNNIFSIWLAPLLSLSWLLGAILGIIVFLIVKKKGKTILILILITVSLRIIVEISKFYH